MKIVFLSRYQDQLNRGAENFVKELSTRLSVKYQVEILTGADADSLSKVLSGGYDIVIPINGRWQGLKISLGRLIGKYKVLITGHSGIGKDDIWNIVLGKPDMFVALTDWTAKWAKDWAWGSRVVKIPNGIDLVKFSPRGEKKEINLPKPIILSAGALVWYKHHERVIRAVREVGLASRSKGVSLVVAGQGPEREKLEKLGKELLGERFMIADFKYEDMPAVYRSVDLFTLPSWEREAFGMVYLEAMASGLGVVVPDDASRREVVGDGGLFTDVADPVKYGETIKKALRFNWSKKAREQAEKFSWEKIAGEYEKVISDMIKV